MDDGIPDFLKLTKEERAESWKKNPPKAIVKTWKTSEQELLEKQRQQKLADQKRMQRCVSKQKREIRKQTQDTILEDRSHAAQGHKWDVRTARWIDPIEAAFKEGKKPMPAAAKKEKTKLDNRDFGFRKDTNYYRMMQYLQSHMGQKVSVDVLAKEAYGSNSNLQKHRRRVIAMLRRVQLKVINTRRMPFNIVKEVNSDAVSFSLVEK